MDVEIAAFHVPVIDGLFVDEVGKTGASLLRHKDGIAVNVGVTTGVITTLPVTRVEEHPD